MLPIMVTNGPRNLDTCKILKIRMYLRRRARKERNSNVRLISGDR